MSMSLKVAQECHEAMHAFGHGSRNQRPGYVLFKIENGQVCLVKSGAPTDTYQDFVQQMPADDARWGCLTVNYSTVGGGDRSKSLFVSWIPSGASRIDKMQYAAFQGGFRRTINAPRAYVSAHSVDDLSEEELLARASKFEVDQVDVETGIMV